MDRSLLRFLECVSLFILAGYDLSFAWHEATATLSPQIQTPVGKGEGFGERLLDLSRHYPLVARRVWFRALHDLYTQGAPLSEALDGVTRALRLDQEVALEAFTRDLPLRVNVLLIVWLIPPTLWLLFWPLLGALETL